MPHADAISRCFHEVTRQRLRFLTGLAGLAGLAAISCSPAPPALPPAPASAGPSASAAQGGPRPRAEPEPPPPEVLAAARAIGPLHGEPLPLPEASPGARRWAVFVGDEQVARAAFSVALGDEGPEVLRLADLPVGAAVVAARATADELVVVLRSVAVLDQPAALSGAVTIPLGNPPRTMPLERLLRLSTARDAAQLSALLSTEPPAPKALPPADEQRLIERRAALIDSARNHADLGDPVSALGAPVVTLWQQSLFEPVAMLSRGKLDGPGRASLRSALEGLEPGSCSGARCRGEGEGGERYEVDFALEDGEARVRSVVVSPLPPPGSLGQGPRRVAPSQGVGSSTAEALLQLEDARFRVLAEAPLTEGPLAGGGTVAVAINEGSNGDGARVVVRDGQAWQSRTVWLHAPIGAGDVRFADVDGDGRTDVMIGSRGEYGGKVVARYPVYLSPRSLADEPDSGSTWGDAASVVASFDRRTIDEALDAALALPRRGVSRRELCSLIASSKGAPSLAGAASPGARFISYTEPGAVQFGYRATPLSAAARHRVERLRDECPRFVCSPGRPACFYGDPPGFDVVTVLWRGGKLRLGDALLYEGS